MTQPCTVLIGAPDLLPVLKKRTGDGTSEMIVFSDADALHALDVITKRRPRLVALERLFAATPRGAALINRIKADPTLVQSEIRVVSHDTDYSRVLTRANGDAAAAGTGGVAAPSATAPDTTAAPLDQRGTRRAPRFSIAAKVEVTVDGNTAALVDLSLVGAQVIGAGVLKPNQRVRMALSDEAGILRFNASVAWAKFEIPPGSGPRYRAGIDFVDADPAGVEAYCARHRVS